MRPVKQHRAASGPASSAQSQLLTEELDRVHAHGRAVRARVDAGGLLLVPVEVAGRRLLLHDGLLARRVLAIDLLDEERVHVDVAVGALLRAVATTDAPVLDDDLQRLATPDGADRTAHHAERVPARAARRRHQVFVVAQAVPYQAGHAVVRVGARLHAEVTARAALEVDEQEVLRLHEPLRDEVVDGHRPDGLDALLIRLQPRVRDLAQPLAHLRIALDDLLELLDADPHELDVVERGAGGRAQAAGPEEPDLADVRPPGQVGENEVAPRERLRDLHEPHPDEVEAVGGVALPEDHLPRLDAHPPPPPRW